MNNLYTEPKPSAAAPSKAIVPEEPVKPQPTPNPVVSAPSAGNGYAIFAIYFLYISIYSFRIVANITFAGKDNTIKKTSNYRVLARSDLMGMLPIVGSLKLVVDTVKAVYHKDAHRSLWKGAQTSISIFADFHL